MGLLMALITLLCACTPVCRAEGCSRFRNLDNGQTFFRYGGLLVVFRCHPGFKLHGHQANSCMSGQWSRDPPVCVGSGCSHPGPLPHGTSSTNEDGSWARFSCNDGFWLHGPSMLYCKGRVWNSTKPVCKEFDMMRSIPDVSQQRSKQGLAAASPLKMQHLPQYDNLANPASKDVALKLDPFSGAPSRSSTSGKFGTNLKADHLRQHHQLPKLKVKHWVQSVQRSSLTAKEARGPEKDTASQGSESKSPRQEAERESLTSASELHLSTTVSSTVSLVPGTERSTSSPPSFPTAPTPAVTAFTNIAVNKFSLPRRAKFFLPVRESQELTTSQDDVTRSEVATVNMDLQSGSSSPSHSLSHPPPAAEEEPEEASPYSLSTSANSVFTSFSSTTSPAVSISSSPVSEQSNARTKLPYVTPRSETSTDSSNLRRNVTSTSFLSLGGRPVCPYPPVPSHGTFYFRNVENPGPKEYKHYIQYACYPGFTLAHGDIHSYCQRGGTWSGVTPVCLELTPCSVTNGGCSQLCSRSSHNQTRTQCHCRPGFTLLDDGRTCRDINECVESQHGCQQRCINTFGSFKCACNDGYRAAHDHISCTDVDECLLPVAVTGCVFGCVNTLGSFYCQCPAGYSLQSANDHCQDIDECAANRGLGPCMEQCHNSPGSYRCSCAYGRILAGDGHGCVAECPPGYRKQPTATPDNSTAPTPREECVDIDECREETCEWQCINLPGSHRCICPRGYTLQRDGRRCKDINECTQKNGGCSHMCLNQRGSYKCACPSSHRLSPYSWKKCLPKTTANRTGNHLSHA